MNNYLVQLENALKPFAEKYVPTGSTAKAVTDQWLHALANETSFFAQSKGVTRAALLSELENAAVVASTKDLKNAIYSDLPLKPFSEPKFTFIDLFAGIGGMRLGFQNNGGICVFSSEFEKNAQATYSNNHGEFPFGDITKVNEYDVPRARSRTFFEQLA